MRTKLPKLPARCVNFDDIKLALENLEKEENLHRDQAPLTRVSNIKTSRKACCSKSSGFKKPQTLNRHQPLTPKLINLSFSVPSTPKTPCLKHFPCATPFIRITQRDTDSASNISLTPLLKEPLHLFNNVKSHTDVHHHNIQYPDILEMIDDDAKQIEDVEQELNRLTEVSLCDSNIVDYLLHMSDDYSKEPPKQSAGHVEEYKSPIHKKRKCRWAKPVSYEESLVYKEEKKKKDKERRKRRKELFKTRSVGQRKGLRRSRPVKYF